MFHVLGQGGVCMSRSLEASLKRIDEVFEKCFRNGITPGGGRWGENTKETYSDLVKSLNKDLYEEFGKPKIEKASPEEVNQLMQKRIDAYHSGSLKEASNLKTMASAVNAFQKGVQETNVYKKEFTLMDTKDFRENLKEQNVLRHSAASPTLRATPDECKEVLENIKSGGYQTPTREMSFHVGRISMATGGRISSVLKLRVGDFKLDSKTNEIRFYKDKGGLTRSVRIGSETAKYLEKLADGKREDQRIFSMTNSDGKFKSIQTMRKEISKVIEKAGEHLGRKEEVTVKDKDGKKKTVEVKRKFTHHSFRKSFALERTKEYVDKFSSKSAVKKYNAERIKADPKLKQKLETLKERINKHRDKDRELKPSELAIFYASVDMGHFRNDVITAWYTSFKEVEAYYNEVS
jgi:integrase